MIEITDRGRPSPSTNFVDSHSSWGHRVALWTTVALFGGLTGLVLFYWP